VVGSEWAQAQPDLPTCGLLLRVYITRDDCSPPLIVLAFVSFYLLQVKKVTFIFFPVCFLPESRLVILQAPLLCYKKYSAFVYNNDGNLFTSAGHGMWTHASVNTAQCRPTTAIAQCVRPGTFLSNARVFVLCFSRRRPTTQILWRCCKQCKCLSDHIQLCPSSRPTCRLAAVAFSDRSRFECRQQGSGSFA
jgi:hypothetical protein